MRRIDTSTKAANLFGVGKDGWQGGNPATNTPATQLNAAWFNSVQEEIAGVIEGAGGTLDPTNNGQLLSAINRLIVDTTISINVGGGGVITLSSDQVANDIFYLTGTPAVPVALVFPAAAKRMIVDIGAVNQPVTLIPLGGSGITLMPGSAAVDVFCNGAGVIELTSIPMVMASLGTAGKNNDNLRTDRSLVAGTDPRTIVESGLYTFDPAGSPNMPEPMIGIAYLSVSRHSVTTASGGVSGQNIFVRQILSDGLGHDWECRATTSGGVTSWSAWIPIFTESGTIAPYAGTSSPSGWLVANGASLSCSVYSRLFSKLVKSSTVTVSIATPGVITWSGHGLLANDVIKFGTTGTLPTGIVAGTTYYVVGSSITSNTFQISATAGGTAIALTGTQSGVHTAINAPYGYNYGDTVFGLPDLRGKFVRGADLGAGVDPNRSVGSLQASMSQIPVGVILRGATFGVPDTGIDATGVSSIAGAYDMAPAPLGNSSALYPESRPINMSFLWCIKY